MLLPIVFQSTWDRIPLTTLLISSTNLLVQVALKGTCPVQLGWRVPASQLDLSSRTPLSIAGDCPLQLGDAHLATSVVLLQVVGN